MWDEFGEAMEKDFGVRVRVFVCPTTNPEWKRSWAVQVLRGDSGPS